MKVKKRYSVVVPGHKPVVVRQTSTIQHALKHACYVSELRISVRVRDNQFRVTVLEIPAIDRAHAVKPHNKRDRRYAKLAKQGASK